MVADLSEKHQLLGDLFTLPKTRDDWEQYRLSNEQLEFYREKGFLPGVRDLVCQPSGCLV